MAQHPITINSDGSSTVTSDGSPDVEVIFDLRRGTTRLICEKS